ncbi:MAG: M24 family metallopeptidase, partial [Termitinemataceae bacterium]
VKEEPSHLNALHESSVHTHMAQENIELVMLEDTEGRRDPTIRYLVNHPGDALLFLPTPELSTPLLVPWDVNLAKTLVSGSCTVIPYTDFERNPFKALRGVINYLKLPEGSKIEIPSSTPYPVFLKYVELFPDYDIICREHGTSEVVTHARAVKKIDEITKIQRACEITNEIIVELEERIGAGFLTTEVDIALFIEKRGRELGGEGTGFETLVAGSQRSWGIHAFPTYTSESFGTQGLSIIDFGIKYQGYTSDVTLTIARGPLNKAQEKMLKLVEKAYKLALSMAAPGIPTRDIARAVDDLFAKSKMNMPHALGHGIGLEAHEAPAIRNRSDNDWVLENGMVFTLEPGLYHSDHGGCRLENDILLINGKAEELTQARIIRIPE